MRILTGERTPTDRDRASDRRAGRLALEIPIQIRSQNPGHEGLWNEGLWTGVTKNICAGGVFVVTLRAFSVGERVTLRLRMPGEVEPVEALAEVCWSRPFQELDDRPAGIGLRFVDTPLRVFRVMRLTG